jgi:hypothetical protein
VDALRDLRQLERVAKQDEVLRRRPHRQRIGKRDLARLVDEQVVERRVELCAREEPRGAGEQLQLRVEKGLELALVLDQLAGVVMRVLVAGAALLQAVRRQALLLELAEQVVDRLASRAGPG